MLKKRSLLFLASIFFFNGAHAYLPRLVPSQTRRVVAALSRANILETNTLKTLMEHVQDHDTIIFDLDNTLIELAHHRGNDQWFSAMLAYAQEMGHRPEDAGKKVLPRYFGLQHAYPLKLVEDDGAQIIERLHRSGKKVVGLTSRSLALKGRTVDELKRLGITFSRMIEHDEHDVHGLDARYAHGILFCGWHNKGKVLTSFFEQHGYEPKKIIFVDDKHKYLTAVDEHVTPQGIEFLGIRYGGCDHKVRDFVLPEDDKQWLHTQLTQES